MKPHPFQVGIVSVAMLGCPPAPRSISAPQPAQATSCANRASADTTVYDTADVAEQPRARVVPQLAYPPEAQRRHIQGRVVVGATVNGDGTIDQSSVTVLHSVDPLLDAEAQRFARGATLWPACRNGEAVRVRIAVPVVFDAGYRAPGIEESFLIGLGVGLVMMVVDLARGK